MHIYIHIPFCKQKCSYCDFVSGAYSQNTQDQYTAALIEEINEMIQPSMIPNIKTIYIGGGTPSALSLENLEHLFQALAQKMDLSALAEFTVEGNPESVSPEFANLCAKYHVNRVSLGVQTTNEQELVFLGRIHTNEQVKQATQALKKAGITNFSLDLIFALPNQKRTTLLQSLKDLIAYSPQHISCYSLIIEEKTLLMKKLKLHEFEELSDDEYVNEYRLIIDTLKENGYNQYEISNFARLGFESKHNSAYWDGSDYLGLGVSAHSKIGSFRFSNVNKVEDYILQDQINLQEIAKSLGAPTNQIVPLLSKKLDPDSLEYLGDIDKINEMIFLGLRRNQGILLEDLMDKILALPQGEEKQMEFLDEMEHLIKEGLLEKIPQGDNPSNPVNILTYRVSLTQRGREISNHVFSNLML